MAFEALDLVERLRGEIALATLGASDNGYVLDDDKVFARAIRSSDAANAGAGFSTTITGHGHVSFSRYR